MLFLILFLLYLGVIWILLFTEPFVIRATFVSVMSIAVLLAMSWNTTNMALLLFFTLISYGILLDPFKTLLFFIGGFFIGTKIGGVDYDID